MKILLSKVGGILGSPRPSAQLDTTSLSDGERCELRELLDAANFWELPGELPGDPNVRDALSTILEVADGARTHAVGFDLSAAPAALREVVSKVRALAQQGSKRR